MTEPEDPIDELPKQLAASLGALVVVALVVAGVLGVVALGAASYLVGEESPTAAEEATMYVPAPPPESPAGTERDDADGSGDDAGDGRDGQERTAKGDRRPQGDKAGKKRRGAGEIVLRARPLRAAPFERVRLFGRYPGGNGTTLQVQRKQGRWVFFPASATVSGGRFETWVQSGRRGVNEFRVVDRASGARSRPVEVRIRP